MMDWRQRKAIEAKNRKRWLEVNDGLSDASGIYVLTREDEDGFKYAYIGQAKKCLQRLCEHMVGYQHIDLSLKKHGLFSKDNPHGWLVGMMRCNLDELDAQEQFFIKEYANAGYQLRNKTSGSQGAGKRQIDDYKPHKGYRDGIEQGRKNLARELSAIADKHLEIRVKPEKVGNKVSEKQFEKFNFLLRNESEVEDGR